MYEKKFKYVWGKTHSNGRWLDYGLLQSKAAIDKVVPLTTLFALSNFYNAHDICVYLTKSFAICMQ